MMGFWILFFLGSLFLGWLLVASYAECKPKPVDVGFVLLLVPCWFFLLLWLRLLVAS